VQAIKVPGDGKGRDVLLHRWTQVQLFSSLAMQVVRLGQRIKEMWLSESAWQRAQLWGSNPGTARL